MYLKMRILKYMKSYFNNFNNFINNSNLKNIKLLFDDADAILIGGGAGLSTSAGLYYSGERFTSNFQDFIQKYNLTDMYSSAFYEFPDRETHWAYWSKHIYLNRFADIDSTLNNAYPLLLNLVKNKNYFILTTNADNLFIRSGFSKNSIFYVQGNYGLFQCSRACHDQTYDNQDIIYKMLDYQRNTKNSLVIPSELIPYCPKCGAEMSPNIRKDNTFIQDDGWYEALERYENFLSNCQYKKIIYLELGVGYNTPTIIKFPFWELTISNPLAYYICVNSEVQEVPQVIKKQTHLINDDIYKFLLKYTKLTKIN